MIGLHMNYLIYPGASILGGRILRPVKIKEGKSAGVLSITLLTQSYSQTRFYVFFYKLKMFAHSNNAIRGDW